MIRTRSIRLVLATVALAFGLGTAHSGLHDFEPAGSGPSVHGVACDEAHGEPGCPVCLGHAPHRKGLRSPNSGGPYTTHPALRALHTPGSDPVVAIRIARPEAARAPPRPS
ncbi:MAG: hypothetical protein OEP95_15470 [Myxococcales bacterium]|nr:hypothetical protein [Myxococcales bacterium]